MDRGRQEGLLLRVLSVFDDTNGSGWSLVLTPGMPDYLELIEENKNLKLQLAEALVRNQKQNEDTGTLDDREAGSA